MGGHDCQSKLPRKGHIEWKKKAKIKKTAVDPKW
jgi:hypothetical protein